MALSGGILSRSERFFLHPTDNDLSMVEALKKENETLRNRVKSLEIGIAHFKESFFHRLLKILLDKIQRSMHWEQISPQIEYLTVSLDGFDGFEDFLKNFDGG